MRIGELARAVGLSTSAIRYYEGEGLIASPPRAAGQRSYAPSAVTELRVVLACQEAGFTIAETRTVMREVRAEKRPLSSAWRRMAEKKLVELAEAAARLAAMQQMLGESLRCGCVGPDTCEVLLGARKPRPAVRATGAARRR